MAPSLPAELLLSISQQWPCRELQIIQLASLLSPYTPSPPAIIVHGIEATGKSGIVRSVISQHSQRQINGDHGSSDGDWDSGAIPHAYIRCGECVTGRHLLSKILTTTVASLGLAEGAVKDTVDHVNGLAVVLKDILEGRRGGGDGVKKFVLVLDGVEEQREAQQFLLPALTRLGEVIPSLCVVMVISSTPQPLAFEVVGIPHIYFPPYTRKEAISIVTSTTSHPTIEGEISPETASRLFPQFVSTVYDSLIGPTASTIPSFRSACARLWPQFIAPITHGEKPFQSGGGEDVVDWDFPRLLVKNRKLFQQHGEGILVHRIAAPSTTTATTTTTATKDTSTSTSNNPSALPLSLPYLPTLVLTSAYLATYTHPRLDTVLFSKFASSASARRKRNHHQRKLKKISAQTDTSAPPLQGEEAAGTTPKKQGPGRPRKGQTKAKREIIGAGSGLSARPFPLERLLAIYRAIDPDPTLLPSSAKSQKNGNETVTMATADVVADVVYTELATLHRLRLVVPASGSGGGGGGGGGGGTRGDTLPGGSEAVDAGEKWRVNVSGEWIVGMAKRIGVDVQEFVGDVF